MAHPVFDNALSKKYYNAVVNLIIPSGRNLMEDTKNLSDEQIIQRIVKGETDLFSVLLDRHLTSLKGTIHNCLLRNTDNSFSRNVEAEDLLSEIMMKIFSNLNTFDSSKASFKTWISHIASNHIIDWGRKKKLKIWHPIDEDVEYNPMDHIPSDELAHLDRQVLREIINEVIDTIQNMSNKLLQTYIACKFVMFMPDKELAEFVDVSESAVRSNLCRAIREFKKELIIRYKEYADRDIGEIVESIKNGCIRITEDQIAKISDLDAQFIAEQIGIRRRKIEDIASEKGLSKDTIKKLAYKALKELITKGLKRRIKETIPETELTENEITLINKYVALALEGEKEILTRGESENEQMREIKPWIDLLAAATTILRTPVKVLQIGDLLLKKAAETQITMDELAEKLKLNVHELSELLNNKVSEKNKTNKYLLKRIAGFLELPQKSLETLMATSFPKGYLAQTRNSSELSMKKESELKNKIKGIVVSKFGK